MYTRVLRGNLDYERLIFPEGRRIKQINIDLLARRHLWAAGEDYCHGTGHGVGHCLNVHEGPYGKELQAGHTWTDEPGFYKDGEFGIRIENLLILQKHESLAKRLYWENVTVHPYCRELIDTQFLTHEEIDHINKYHDHCRDLLEPLVKDDPLAVAYLHAQTAPLSM